MPRTVAYVESSYNTRKNVVSANERKREMATYVLN